MLDDLVILHVHPGAKESLPIPLHSVQWQTCLRKILFLHRNEICSQSIPVSVSPHVYKGGEAYEFLLEVVCGLKSPLLGETEVMGQFRTFCSKLDIPSTAWDWFVQQLSDDILADAKQVRRDHLQKLGSQSYGSLVRHHLAQTPVTAMLGSGQLAQEILPWITSKTRVRLFHRNRTSAESLQARYPQIDIEPLTAAPADWDEGAKALLIVAPLSADQIVDWIQLQDTTFSKIIDLRGEAAGDPLRISIPVIALPDLFATLGRDRHRLEAAVAAARAEIKQLTQRRIRQAQFRPFGWEDLCA